MRSFLAASGDWSFGQFFCITLLFAIVCLAGACISKLMARTKRKRFLGRMLEIGESLHVSPQALVAVVRAGSRWFLVGVTKESVSLIAEMEPEEANIAQPKSSFEKSLEKFFRKEEGA
ncbi:MAG: flagellar biosynthetic protein FliO [Clostridiales bacterium]|nr:flagellar biosynthetic protein FliO [Clostridiales bacterium]